MLVATRLCQRGARLPYLVADRAAPWYRSRLPRCPPPPPGLSCASCIPDEHATLRLTQHLLPVLRSISKDVFNTYVCQSSVDRGLPHPGDIAESTSLRCVYSGNAIESINVPCCQLMQVQLRACSPQSCCGR